MSVNKTISLQQFPEGKQQMDFLDSSFFNVNGPKQRFPTPGEVRALATGHASRSHPVIFEHLNLLVKFGPQVTIAEAQSQWIVRSVFGDKVPVPEVYGWRVDEDTVFIYMELIRGQTLLARWDSLSEVEKTQICAQLYTIIEALREVKQDPSQQFIGSVDGQSLLDHVFEFEQPAGPFASVGSFHDWISELLDKRFPNSEKVDDPWRHLLPDSSHIKFTHADLHRANILISSSGPPQVLAIIDWGQSGWYPGYWEYSKAAYTALHSTPWRDRWIPMFLTPRPYEFRAIWDYTMALGVV